MSGDEIAALSLADVGEIAEKEISSLEATEAAPTASSVTETPRSGALCQDAARASARKADEDLASGNVRGPMHGVPLAHKDMYYRAGWTAACGSNILDGFVPDVTSTAIQRLDAAGRWISRASIWWSSHSARPAITKLWVHPESRIRTTLPAVRRAGRAHLLPDGWSMALDPTQVDRSAYRHSVAALRELKGPTGSSADTVQCHSLIH